MNYKFLRSIFYGGSLLIVLGFMITGCKAPSKNNEPQKDDWLTAKLTFNQLPGFNNPQKLTFNLTVKGKDGALPIGVTTGEVMDQLWMKFSIDKWIEGINQDADTSWKHYGTVKIGDKFRLEPIFQFKKDVGNHWSNIGLIWSFEPKNNKLGHSTIGYTLSFNDKTGEWYFK